MYKRYFAIFLAALAILSFASFGCKGKSAKAPEAPTTEAPLEEVGIPITEPAQTVATETIPPTAAPEPLVAPPEKPDRDKEIQIALRNAGFYAGAIDGKIGPKTKKAIEEFQKAKGLKVDGKVGPKTWAELEKYLTQ